MSQERIQVYTDKSTKRLIELAAIKQDIPMTKFCLEAIKQQLVDEDMLGKASVEIPVQLNQNRGLFANLRALQQEIKRYRKGKPIEVENEIQLMRQQRDQQHISNLH